MSSRLLITASLAILCAAGISQQTAMQNNATEVTLPVKRESQPKRHKNKTNNKIRVFMGYASDRKGKGQKKRDASQRQKKGWL